MIDKTYDSAAVEPRIAKLGTTNNAFRAGAGAIEGADPFCIVIPPPNVTGSLHMGHALNNTLQDVLVRFERMRGKDVLWQPGMDHAGIATQMVVERQLMERQLPGRRAMGREAFVDKVWEWKAESGGLIFNQLKRWARRVTGRASASPWMRVCPKAVLEVFVTLYKEGLIYRGKRLVNWDPQFETASPTSRSRTARRRPYVALQVSAGRRRDYTYVEKDADGNVTFQEERDYIANRHHPAETCWAMARSRSILRMRAISRSSASSARSGRAEGHRRLIPIITDEYPDPTFGSGAVKITGAHDFNDYQVAKRNNIPLYRLMDTQAQMRADGEDYATYAAQAQEIARSGRLPSEAEIDEINLVPEDYRGLDRFEARKRIVAAINAEAWPSRSRMPRATTLPMSRTRRSCSLSATAPMWSSNRC